LFLAGGMQSANSALVCLQHGALLFTVVPAPALAVAGTPCREVTYELHVLRVGLARNLDE
jgi:hypothetical protein